MRNKLTAIMPVKDERLNIRPCIESFREFADEILIADSGSTDGTMDIARDAAGAKCRIVEREYIHSGDFKNWAIPQAAHEWVLLVDADERITPELAKEITEILSGTPDQDGYWIYRDNHFMGRPIRYCGLQNDCCLRLFRRDMARYVGANDHARIKISTGRVGKLKTKMTHYTYWTYDQFFKKFERYTKWQSHVWNEKGRRPSYFQLLTRAPYRFIRDYIFQRGFLDGLVGLQYCMLQGFYSFMKEARLWERQCALPQTDPEAEHLSRTAQQQDCSESEENSPKERRSAA